jgi:hypothetical protein
VTEDEFGDEESEKNSNDTIADVIEIGIGRESLENAEEESERRERRSHLSPDSPERENGNPNEGVRNKSSKSVFAGLESPIVVFADESKSNPTRSAEQSRCTLRYRTTE